MADLPMPESCDTKRYEYPVCTVCVLRLQQHLLYGPNMSVFKNSQHEQGSHNCHTNDEYADENI